jgi:DNA-binding MarR family transcriptional regulator
MSDRASLVHRVQNEITALSRRARSSASGAQPELSWVDYTLLSHVQQAEGCRASDLVAYFGLEKSTISRQVTALVDRGLIERGPDPADARARSLTITPLGNELLEQTHENLQLVIEARLQGWSDPDIALLAELLARYNGNPRA